MDLHQDLIDLLSAFDRCEVEHKFIRLHGRNIGDQRRRGSKFSKRTNHLREVVRIHTDPQVEVLRVPRLAVRRDRPTANDEVVFGTPPARIDLLRQIPGVTFEEAWRRRLDTQWNGHDVHVIGLDDLIAAKRAADRPKDLADLKQLEALRQQR